MDWQQLQEKIPNDSWYKVEIIDEYGRKTIGDAVSKQDVLNQIKANGPYLKSDGWATYTVNGKTYKLGGGKIIVEPAHGKEIVLHAWDLPASMPAKYNPPPSPSGGGAYQITFTDKEGNKVTYNALNKQKALQIAEKYSKVYKNSKITLKTPDDSLYDVIVKQKNEQNIQHDKVANTQAQNTKQELFLDGALYRAATDEKIERLRDVKKYAQKLIDEGKSPQEIQKALQERYGVQANIKTITFKESPEAAMYKQIEKEEKAREAAEEAQNAVDEIMASNSPSYAIISELNKIGKGIENRAKQLNNAAMKNTNPAIAYAEAVGAALLGAGAGVAELPEQTVEFVASASKNPVKAVKSLLFAPVTTVEEAAKDVESGNVADYGKIVGQTFAAGEVADELGITPSRAIEKIPYTEKVLAPAREFAERATAKLNDVVVKPLTEYKPVRSTVIVDTGEENPVVTVSPDQRSASLGALKDIGKIKEIKPVSAVVAETAFNLKTEPVEELAEFKNPVSEGVKARGEEAEGIGVAKTRLKTGYELQTENPVRSIKVVTEYANRLGRKAVIASEIGEDMIKMLLRKGGEVKGYGVKVVDTYPLWDQEIPDLSELRFSKSARVFGEAKEAIPEKTTVKTIDLRVLNDETAKIDLSEMDNDVRKVFGEDRSTRGTGGQMYELKEETSRYKIVDVSEELKTLESELNEEIELPDISKAFEKAIVFGKDALDVGVGLGVAGLNGMSELERSNVRNTISNILYNDIIGGQKEREAESSKSRPDVTPAVTPATSTKPSTSVTPATTPDVTLATAVIPYISPEPETNTKSKSKKPEPPEPPLFFPGGGGEGFYRIIEEEGDRFGRAIKVNPVIDNPLSALFGGGKKRRRKKR